MQLLLLLPPPPPQPLSITRVRNSLRAGRFQGYVIGLIPVTGRARSRTPGRDFRGYVTGQGRASCAGAGAGWRGSRTPFLGVRDSARSRTLDVIWSRTPRVSRPGRGAGGWLGGGGGSDGPPSWRRHRGDVPCRRRGDVPCRRRGDVPCRRRD